MSRPVVALAAVLLVAVVVWVVVSRWQSRQTALVGPGTTPPSSTVPSDSNKEGAQKPAPSGTFEEPPKIEPDANASVKSVVEAARTGTHAEQLSPMLKPKEFSLSEFEADVDGFCRFSVPGRVWQTATPGPTVKAIQAKGVALLTASRGGKVQLTVRGEAKAPTTFTSFDAGEFPNRLTSITVRADENGEASTQFEIVAGTPDNVRILAASPLTAGQVEFCVRVK